MLEIIWNISEDHFTISSRDEIRLQQMQKTLLKYAADQAARCAAIYAYPAW